MKEKGRPSWLKQKKLNLKAMETLQPTAILPPIRWQNTGNKVFLKKKPSPYIPPLLHLYTLSQHSTHHHHHHRRAAATLHHQWKLVRGS